MDERLGPRTFFRSGVNDYVAEHYGHGARSYMSARLEEVLDTVASLPLAEAARALDAGCGPGHLLAAARDSAEWVGIDASPEMVRAARERLRIDQPADTQLAVADVERLPFDNRSFDLVCSNGVIEYLQNDTVMLEECFRVLRPGGWLVISVTNVWSPAGYLDFLVERLKQIGPIRRAVNAVWTRMGHAPVRPRHFRVRRHRPAALRKGLEGVGFGIERDRYFYVLPWPHPFDRIAPRVTARLSRRLDSVRHGPLRWLGEGYLTLCRKPG